MQIAHIDGEPSEPFKNGRGNCPMCGSEMIAKCGQRVMHHWAHHRTKNCDPWWENETPWHRDWKNHYPLSCREVSHTAEDGEIHRADVKTPTGIIIELQHSPISDSERMARENFYKNLVWVVDGSCFYKNFDIYHMLPAPNSAIAQDIVWSKAKRGRDGANRGLFFRVSEARQENPGVSKATVRGGWIHSLREIEEDVALSYRGHHQYDWVRPRRTWLSAECPVYIDFGGDYLSKLESYDDSDLPCVQLVAKRKFLHDSMHEKRAEDIATRFYRID